MSHNPFEAPASMDVPSSEVLVGGLPLATQGQRFVNLIIDQIIIQICSFIGGLVLGGVYVASNGGAALSPDQSSTLELLGFAVGIVVVIGYFIVMEALFQRTIGKMATGTRVVTVNGGVPSFGQIVGRSFARLIPFEAFSFLGKIPCGWHDTLSGTRVIKSR